MKIWNRYVYKDTVRVVSNMANMDDFSHIYKNGEWVSTDIMDVFEMVSGRGYRIVFKKNIEHDLQDMIDALMKLVPDDENRLFILLNDKEECRTLYYLEK